MSARVTVADVSPKWTVVKIVDTAPRVEAQGRWAAYPPDAAWGEWAALFDTWQRAYIYAYLMANTGSSREVVL